MLRRVFTFLILLPLVSSCTREVEILKASASIASGDDVTIQAIIKYDDIKSIKDNEIYAGFVLLECSRPDDRFPFDAMVGGKRSPHYIINEKSSILVTGTVPKKIYGEFKNPCLSMEGGSYTGMSIKTKPVPLN